MKCERSKKKYLPTHLRALNTRQVSFHGGELSQAAYSFLRFSNPDIAYGRYARQS